MRGCASRLNRPTHRAAYVPCTVVTDSTAGYFSYEQHRNTPCESEGQYGPAASSDANFDG
jgi:hypothetical protein